MLLLSERLKYASIMSLQTGMALGKVTQAIIDPAILEVVAYRIQGPRLENSEQTLLMTKDIREVSEMGLIIDSVDELVFEDDIIKVKKIIELNFNLIGMQVIDDKKVKLGKVYAYSLDPATFTIHQLNVKRPLIRSLQQSELVIRRTQIKEINNHAIVVNSATLDEKPKPAALGENFVNPFRKPGTAPPSSARD